MLRPSEFLTLKESKNLKVFLNILDVRGVKTADDALKNREQVRTTLNSWIHYAKSREDTRTFYTKERQDAVKTLNSLIKHDELGDDEPVIQQLEKDAQHCESEAPNRAHHPLRYWPHCQWAIGTNTKRTTPRLQSIENQLDI